MISPRHLRAMRSIGGLSGQLARPPQVLPEPDIKPSDGKAGEWYTQEADGTVISPGDPGTIIPMNDLSGYSSGDDPGGRIYLDTTDPTWAYKRVIVDGGIRLRAEVVDVGAGNFWTGAGIFWVGDGITAAGTITGHFVFVDSALTETELATKTNYGSVELAASTPFQDQVAWMSLTDDFVVPSGGGYLYLWLENPTARTLTILQGSSIVLEWASE